MCTTWPPPPPPPQVERPEQYHFDLPSLLEGVTSILLRLGPPPSQVDRPEQYHFDLPSLLEGVTSFLLRLVHGGGAAFITILAQEPDYDRKVR